MSTDNIITIRKRNPELALSAFTDFMAKTVAQLNAIAEKSTASVRSLSPGGVEQLCVETMKSLCDESPFSPEDIVLVSGQSFPDIIATPFYGVEVKTTQADHWKSTGSSIIESTRRPDVERIFMLFGKLGGKPEFRCRPYEECLYDITVTHSPRYLIDMDTPYTETIFYKMGIEYDTLRTSKHSIADVRKYYRAKALRENRKEMPWWLDENPEKDSGMMVKLWESIPTPQKNHIKHQMLVLFPEDIIKSNYPVLALWLVAYYKIVCPNVRDQFSAGGQAKLLNDEPLPIPVPAMAKRFLDAVPYVRGIISKDLSLIELYNPKIVNHGNSIYEAWIDQVDTALKAIYGNHVKFKEWVSRGDILKV